MFPVAGWQAEFGGRDRQRSGIGIPQVLCLLSKKVRPAAGDEALENKERNKDTELNLLP